jgi:hypothetical protein
VNVLLVITSGVHAILDSGYVTMKPKSQVYSHFTQNTINNKTSFTCTFCSVVYNFRNATKFACHILKCKKSPQDVKESFRQYDKKSSLLCDTQVLSDSDRASTSQDTRDIRPALMDKDEQVNTFLFQYGSCRVIKPTLFS